MHERRLTRTNKARISFPGWLEGQSCSIPPPPKKKKKRKRKRKEKKRKEREERSSYNNHKHEQAIPLTSNGRAFQLVLEMVFPLLTSKGSHGP
jgi:hypothetical protein